MKAGSCVPQSRTNFQEAQRGRVAFATEALECACWPLSNENWQSVTSGAQTPSKVEGNAWEAPNRKEASEIRAVRDTKPDRAAVAKEVHHRDDASDRDFVVTNLVEQGSGTKSAKRDT